MGGKEMSEYIKDEGYLHLVQFFLDPKTQVLNSHMDELNQLFIPDPQKKQGVWLYSRSRGIS